jgi:hypothetical protein
MVDPIANGADIEIPGAYRGRRRGGTELGAPHRARLAELVNLPAT